MIRFLYTLPLLLCLASLTACSTAFPTSSLLEFVRGQKQPALAQEVRSHNFRLGNPVFLRVFKEEAVMEAWLGDPETGVYSLYKTYPICKFSGGLGPKQAEGDKQAPEGFYLVGVNQLNPNSQFHLSLNLGYPNAYDRVHGRTGSALMIHGGCASTGCFAMTNAGIEEVYLLAENAMRKGQEYVNVSIFPFRMSDENMLRHAGTPWSGFWANLKSGYDVFERTHTPPMVGLQEGQYVFYDREALLAAAAAQTNPSAGKPSGVSSGGKI
jgi:murein L,D-transpeptidase YafK